MFGIRSIAVVPNPDKGISLLADGPCEARMPTVYCSNNVWYDSWSTAYLNSGDLNGLDSKSIISALVLAYDYASIDVSMSRAMHVLADICHSTCVYGARWRPCGEVGGNLNWALHVDASEYTTFGAKNAWIEVPSLSQHLRVPVTLRSAWSLASVLAHQGAVDRIILIDTEGREVILF